ncbi:tomoregulin-2-like [Littorina saxatilis]|uniref:Kazal-like domain-containing protein n=1 Tax=Littorina saxatilis TaxID=31220 RepID=A0AAN9BHC8_9CAEN
MRQNMAYVFLVFGLLAVSSVRCDHKRLASTLCSLAIRIDCANDYLQEADETLCATNGHTYVNLCFFSKDKCTQPDLNIKHFGACQTTTATTSTTRGTATTSTSPPTTLAKSQPPTPPTATTTSTAKSPTTTLDEYEILRRVFCAPESQVNCALFAQAPYCGSDFKIYNNECEFVRAQCSLDIKAQDMTYCTSHGRAKHGHHRRRRM